MARTPTTGRTLATAGNNRSSTYDSEEQDRQQSRVSNNGRDASNIKDAGNGGNRKERQQNMEASNSRDGRNIRDASYSRDDISPGTPASAGTREHQRQLKHIW